VVVSDPVVTPEHTRRFRDEGFFVLERVVPPSDLDALRGQCQRLIDERDREMDRLGVEKLDLDHRGSRYFLHAYDKSDVVRRFLVSDLMAKIARAALGQTAYLFNEQYVVKAAERGMTFGWHQDGGFIDYPHLPYLTCWITLDDVSEANGTVYLLPYSRSGGRDVVEHIKTRTRTTGSGTSATIPAIRSSSPPAASPASPARCSTGAAPTPRIASVAPTSPNTPPSRS
jgi:hypothetical protein